MATSSARWRVAIVLPPREGFGPQSAGAIALLQARLGQPDPAPNARFDPIVIGAKQPGPLFSQPFRAVGIRRWRLRWPRSADARYADGVRDVLVELEPALIEVHNKPDVALRLARWFPPRRIALFLHNDPRGMRGAKSARARADLSARLGRIVCVSRYIAGCWTEGVAGAVPPDVLPNCLDLPALPDQAARENVIVFAGRIVADKGADSFVIACADALPALPGWRAVMIGADRFRPDSPETPFTEKLKSAAAAAGIDLPGYRDHAGVMAALGEAAIAVVPSRWQEPFGLTALEAMASGAALIASRRGGLAELTEGVSVPIDPEDTAGMARAIVELARDPAARARLAEAARERARAYDVPAARQRLDQLRTELLTP
ncbi:glycosyltransferase family 4 protein [Acidisoma sp.]|uniref:glycosyltransferase family 4 protein n=1 Tax=Acidisoma sp. TaxID=1872115 RepID=UPI003AFFDC13